MLRDERLAPTGDAQRRLQMGAHCQHRRTILAQVDGLGHAAPRAPDIGGRTVDHRHHRIIGTGEDGAVMRHDQIGDLGQIAPRVRIVDDERLADCIRAGCHEGEWQRLAQPCQPLGRVGQGVKQQKMHRRRGQHQANPVEPRRNSGGQSGVTMHQYNRACGIAEQSQLRRAGGCEISGRGRIGDHHGEGFRGARFAATQCCHRFRIGCVAQQMEPANALQGDDAASVKRGGDLRNRMAQRGAASGAGDGLGVKASVAGRGIVCGACRTKAEIRH